MDLRGNDMEYASIIDLKRRINLTLSHCLQGYFMLEYLHQGMSFVDLVSADVEHVIHRFGRETWQPKRDNISKANSSVNMRII